MGERDDGQDTEIPSLAAVFEVDVIIFGLVALVWLLGQFCFCACSREGRLSSATARYYILFLRICRDLFTTQTALAVVVVAPNWSLAPLSLGFLSGPWEFREVAGRHCKDMDLLPIADENACLHAGELVDLVNQTRWNSKGHGCYSRTEEHRICRQVGVRFSVAGVKFVSTGGISEPFPEVSSHGLARDSDRSTAQLILSAGLTSDRVALLCLLTALLSLAALIFLDWLQKQIQRADSVLGLEGHFDVIERTLWLQDLPVADSQTDEPFNLTASDIKKIESDLQVALEKKLQLEKRYLPLEGVAIVERVHVAPVVDEWYSASEDLRDSREREDAYHKLSRMPGTSCMGGMMRYWYRSRRNHFARRSRRHQERLRKIIVGKKQLSGSAFVTFRTPEQQEHFLHQQKPCWHCRRGTLFTFGHIPFASVTLRCQQAPDPADILWANLHIPRFSQFVRLFTLSGILFVVMETFIALVTFFPGSGLVESVMHARALAPVAKVVGSLHAACSEALEGVVSPLISWVGGLLPPGVSAHLAVLWSSLADYVPAAGFIVAINFLVLPGLTEAIMTFTREHRHSHKEIKQLHLNFFFLVFNLLTVPCLVFVGKSLQAVHEHSETAGDSMFDCVRKLFWSAQSELQNAQGALVIPYMVHATLLANIACLFPLGHYLSRARARARVVTARDLESVNSPPAFQWSFWYAWSLSIFAAGLILSVYIPSTLPCSALFFSLKHAIDRRSLSSGIYSLNDDTRSVFIPRVLYYITCIIAVWWLLMGISFVYWSCSLAERWHTWVPIRYVQAWAGLLVTGSLALLAHANWSLQATIHAANFDRMQNVMRNQKAMCSSICPDTFERVHDYLATVFGEMPLPRSGSVLMDTAAEEQEVGRIMSEGGTLIWNAMENCTEDVEAVQPALRSSLPCGRTKVAYL